MQFLIDLLEQKLEYLQKGLQFVDAGTNDYEVINKIQKEIKKLTKRIENVKSICFIGKDGKYYDKLLVKHAFDKRRKRKITIEEKN